MLFLLTGCLSKSLTSLQVVPAAGAATAAAGQTSQFQALAMYTESGHASTTQDMTDQATWQSSTPAVATISSTGLATGISAGTAAISATLQGAFGTVVGTSNITVTAAASGGAGGSLSSLAIIPTNQVVVTLNETGQFIAIGMLATGASEDLTNQVAWSSSDVKVATVNSSGLVTGLNNGATTITAIATVSGSAVTTATATFTEAVTGAGTQLPTLTVYKVGNNATAGTVTGAVMNGTVTGPMVIDCGSGSECIGNFPIGSQVLLTAAPAKNSTFGGWSSNCIPYPNNSPFPSPMCMVTINDNDTVGTIFN